MLKENKFLIFGFALKNTRENQLQFKLVRNLCIFKLFNLYTRELK